MDQNNIILVLLLISVLVAFYSIYLGMENSKKIKKINLELNDALRLVDETTRLKREIQEHPQNVVQQPNNELDEYPTLEEINQVELSRENLEQHESEMPLDNNLKQQIESLENMSEEELLNLERKLQNEESDELMDYGNVQNLDEINRHNEEEEFQEENGDDELNEEEDHLEDENGNEENVEEDEHGENGEDEEDNEQEQNTEGQVDENISEDKYPVIGELSEDVLNQYNCEELREICKREELRTRGRKAELVERILKKRSSLQ